MKKNLVRIVAALLVAMLALTLIPMGALAAEIDLYTEAYHSKNPTWKDWSQNYTTLDYEHISSSKPVTIKANSYENMIALGDELYELGGIVDWDDIGYYKNPMKFHSSVTVSDNDYHMFSVGYVKHTHKLSYWYSDGTTHWRECLECKEYDEFHEPFMYQNWCQDGDEDGICNVCGGEVPYHDIKVIEVEGAKITLNRDNASHRTKITADVEAEDGYKVGKVHFVKVREDGSKQEITRYKKNGQFFTYMPTYEMEVSVDVIKK